PQEVRAAALSDDGKLLAAVGSDGAPRLYAAATGQELHRLPGRWEKGPLLFSPGGKRLASADYLWDTATGKVLRQLEGTTEVMALAFSPDGALLAAADYDDTLHLWEVATGQKLRLLRVEEKSPWRRFFQPAFSPDGKTLAAGTYTGQI